jgi:hypothetical protein
VKYDKHLLLQFTVQGYAGSFREMGCDQCTLWTQLPASANLETLKLVGLFANVFARLFRGHVYKYT